MKNATETNQMTLKEYAEKRNTKIKDILAYGKGKNPVFRSRSIPEWSNYMDAVFSEVSSRREDNGAWFVDSDNNDVLVRFYS